MSETEPHASQPAAERAEARQVPPAPLTLRERGGRTVRALSDVGARLYPLRQRQAAGEALSDAEEAELAGLETRYRDLEAELRVMMRPRDPDPGHHGPDHASGADA